MCGTVSYFKDHLQSNLMNRLIDETALSLKGMYLYLERDILQSADSEDMKTLYLKNLNIAYNSVYHQILGRDDIKYKNQGGRLDGSRKNI